MMKLISVHLKYRINFKTLFFISLIILTVIIDLLYNAKIYESKENHYLYYNIYYQQYLAESSFFISIIMIIFASFIPLLGEKDYDDLYLSFCPKEKFILSEIGSSSFLLLMISAIMTSLFLFIPALFLVYFPINRYIFLFFLRVFLGANIFLIISTGIKKIVNNVFGSAAIIIYFWLVKIITDDYDSKNTTTAIKIIQYLTPIMIYDEEKYFYLYGDIYVFLLSIFLIFILTIIYSQKNGI